MTTLALHNTIDTETATSTGSSHFEYEVKSKNAPQTQQPKKLRRDAASTSRFIASGVGLLAILTLEPLYKQWLFDASFDFIIEIQKDASRFEQKLWHAWSNGALAVAMLLPLFLSLVNIRDRSLGCYYFFVGCSMALTMNIAKVFYHQARPHWVHPDVQAFSCSNHQFGNPSGHSLFGLGSALTIWFDFKTKYPSGSSSSLLAHSAVKVFALVLAVLFGLSIGYSRLFLGVHTWNQLLFGWQLGLWMCLTMHYCFRDRFLASMQSLFDPSSPSDQKRKMMIRVLIFVALVILLEYLNHRLQEPKIKKNPMWQYMIKQKCSESAEREAEANLALQEQLEASLYDDVE